MAGLEQHDTQRQLAQQVALHLPVVVEYIIDHPVHGPGLIGLTLSQQAIGSLTQSTQAVQSFLLTQAGFGPAHQRRIGVSGAYGLDAQHLLVSPGPDQQFVLGREIGPWRNGPVWLASGLRPGPKRRPANWSRSKFRAVPFWCGPCLIPSSSA